MPRIRIRNMVIACLGLWSTAALALGADTTASLKKGTPDLKSAGPLAFGPDGILFVGDTKGAALFAIDTGDHAAAPEKHAVEVKDWREKSPPCWGPMPSRSRSMTWPSIRCRETSIFRFRGGAGRTRSRCLVRVHADGKIEEVSLENIRFAKAELPNVPRRRAATGRVDHRHRLCRRPRVPRRAFPTKNSRRG